jgi:enoyl-CoA hydratase
MVVERERRGRVEIIRLNRPDKRNAINMAVSTAIEAALDAVETDPEVWNVILTGNGPVFSAGADLGEINELVGRDGSGGPSLRGGFAGLVQREFSKPIIAAVNGPALAGGFEVVLACDLVVAAQDAIFGLPEVTRGLLAGGGGPIRLAQRIPLATALELAMTGDPISAHRAYELGLVNRVVPAEQVLDEALALAERINANSPAAARGARTLARTAALADDQAAWAANEAIMVEVLDAGDYLEGSAAFLERRPPRWRDPS